VPNRPGFTSGFYEWGFPYKLPDGALSTAPEIGGFFRDSRVFIPPVRLPGSMLSF
jgi:hypothetical protein